MVIPWVGIPLSSVLKRAEPQGKGRLRRVHDAAAALGDARPDGAGSLDWPYVEGLRMDEAMHPLTILAVGLYGKTLMNQNGAPIRLVVPWKYGFKSIKSIVRIRFVDKQPRDRVERSPIRSEYGFYSNVNPEVDHPRWSQAREKRLPAFFASHQTQMFNGYGDQVASMYAGMDLRRRTTELAASDCNPGCLARYGFGAALELTAMLESDSCSPPRQTLVFACAGSAGGAHLLRPHRPDQREPGRRHPAHDRHLGAAASCCSRWRSRRCGGSPAGTSLIQYRRMLGLFAFFYATVHLRSYIAFDQVLRVRYILADIAKRPFITAGMAAFLLMVPLAVTSTKGWIRRLGRRWQLLHRLVYCQRDRRLPAFHLEGQGGDRGAGLLRGDPRRAAGVPARLALPSGRQVPPPTCRRVTLYQRRSGAPRRVVWLPEFGPFTPAELPVSLNFGTSAAAKTVIVRFMHKPIKYVEKGLTYRRQGRLGRVRRAEQHQAGQHVHARSGPTCRCRSPGRR